MKKRFFFPKNHPHFSLNTSNNSLTNPFSWTVTISITFPIKNIKYWKVNCKNIRLRIKILINNSFFVNKQKQHKQNKTMECHAQHLELWQFLYLFKVNILNYLNFNRWKIGLGVKSLKYYSFTLNSSQAVIQKTQ